MRTFALTLELVTGSSNSDSLSEVLLSSVSLAEDSVSLTLCTCLECFLLLCLEDLDMVVSEAEAVVQLDDEIEVMMVPSNLWYLFSFPPLEKTLLT